MNLPKKITPDNITEAVIEVRYVSSKPVELLLGLFFNALNDNYIYTNRPIKPLNSVGFITGGGNVNLFYNEYISIQILPNAFAFSCLNKYIGWSNYKSEIEKVLSAFASTDEIVQWNRIGLRYITEYIERDLKGCTKFEFKFGLPEVESIYTNFRSEFYLDGTRIFLNLSNKVPTIKQQLNSTQAELIPTSIIDIDAIREGLSIIGIENVMKEMQEIHDIEKKVFFSLLTDEFLLTLNPEY